MKNLISKFQEKLIISKGNAIFRIAMMFIFIACFIAVIPITFLNFPYHYNYPVFKVAIPAGHYEVAIKITEQGIELNEKQFYEQVSSNDTTFISVDRTGTAIFMVNKNGSSFYYKKATENPLFYNVEKVIITDNTFLVIEKTRSLLAVIFSGIILPLLVLLIFFLLACSAQWKENGYGHDDNGKYVKKFVQVWI